MNFSPAKLGVLLTSMMLFTSACELESHGESSNISEMTTVSPPARGGVDGGGGKGVICRNSTGDITSVEMLDLFEAKAMYGLAVTKSNDAMEDQIKSRLAKIPDLPGKLVEVYINTVMKNMKLTPAGSAIVPIDDSFEVVVPTNCAVEQLAHYYNDKLIVVSGDFWSKMGPSDRAALILHEAIYAVNRVAGATDSRQSRHIVGSLFDESTDWADWRDGRPSDVIQCAAPGPNAFTAYQDASGYWHLNFQILGKGFVFSKKTAIFPNSEIDLNDAKTFPILRGEDRIGSGISSATTLSSNFEDGDIVVIRKAWENPTDNQGTKIRGFQMPRYYLSWRSGSYPKASFDEVALNCSLTSN